MATEEKSDKCAEFSLVLGGPLYQMWRRTRLSGNLLELLRRRIVVLALLAWVPLMILSILEGNFYGDKIKLPFLHDVEMHIRLLLVIPLMIAAELIIHKRLRPIVMSFIERGIVTDSARAEFNKVVESAMKLRNSISAELILIAFVYVVGIGYLWRTQFALDVVSWYGVATADGLKLSLAGWWLGCVSIPLFQFLLLRWYYRLFIWARFLWKVSKLDLNIFPTHPDRCGGLGFLSMASQAFTPLLLIQGVMLAGMITNRILYTGATLPEFKIELIGTATLMVLIILGPMLFFMPKLSEARRQALYEYGNLALRHAREFDETWLRGGAPKDQPLLGSPDISSLADMGGSFEVIREMRPIPFSPRSALHLLLATLLPTSPLLLTVIPLDQLIERLLKVIF